MNILIDLLIKVVLDIFFGGFVYVLLNNYKTFGYNVLPQLPTSSQPHTNLNSFYILAN